jgi:serine/threonine protein kinase
MAQSPCPENQTFEAMLLGDIDDASRSRVLKHADQCGDCADALAALFAQSGARPAGDLQFAETEVQGGSPRTSATPGDIAVGQRITPQIVVHGVLGSGGMGTVYRAHHEGLGCDVAVKVLRNQDAHENAAKRLQREARALAQLPTEHVVRIFDVGALPNGQAYLVMELLPGESLREHLRARGVLSANEAIALAIKICNAVAPAHARGIVHRDLKPDNIFVLPDASIKILDFGLSKLAPDLSASADPGLTHSGAFLGTPLYVAPEQVREAQHVDARADVWAIGVILYEMLTGETPFRRKSVGAVLAAVLTEDAPKLTVTNETSPALVGLVSQCLALAPEKRASDAAQLCELLQQLATTRAPKPFRARHAAMLGGTAVLGGALYLALNLTPNRPSAPLPEPSTVMVTASSVEPATAIPIVSRDAPIPLDSASATHTASTFIERTRPKVSVKPVTTSTASAAVTMSTVSVPVGTAPRIVKDSPYP